MRKKKPKGENIDDEHEIWCAIRYLDPDEKQVERNGVAIISILADTAKKHQQILDESIRLFRERGFSGVSVSELMSAAGLTHGPFYNHFASKESLMSEALAHEMDRRLRAVFPISFRCCPRSGGACQEAEEIQSDLGADEDQAG